jgi:pyrroline-5-carboxylate reductase
MNSDAAPVLLVGAGRLGGAILAGWREAGAFPPGELLVRDPAPGAEARAAEAAGAALNPPDAALATARTVLLAVKPQGWTAKARALAPHLAPDAVVVSVLAGVRAEDLAEAFGGRRVARVMPTTAVAIARGVASLHAADGEARARAHALFDPIAVTVDLAEEALMDAAVGVSGSAPAYLYAFTEALAAAGESLGLPAQASAQLARATMESAAALMAASPDATPAALRAQVTSPRGATEAALDVLLQPDALPGLLRHAAAAAAHRSRELAGAGATAAA